jgi:hypothetical protein
MTSRYGNVTRRAGVASGKAVRTARSKTTSVASGKAPVASAPEQSEQIDARARDPMKQREVHGQRRVRRR